MVEVWDETVGNRKWALGASLGGENTKMFSIESQRFIYPFLPSINSLQVELNNIFMLRKQLEEDVLGNRNLQKILQDQIKDMKNHQGLYPCPAQPSSCTKGTCFYYSQFAGMEKKYLRVKKDVKRFLFERCEGFLFDFLYCRWFGGFVTECLGAIRAHTEGQFLSFHAANGRNSMAIPLQGLFHAACSFVPTEFFHKNQRFLTWNQSVAMGSLSDHGVQLLLKELVALVTPPNRIISRERKNT